MESVELSSNNEQEKKLSDEESTEVKVFKEWYKNKKQEDPDVSEDALRKTIISGLGYKLGIPGYGLFDYDDPSVNPTEEQQARLEELYRMVIDSSEKGEQ